MRFLFRRLHGPLVFSLLLGLSLPATGQNATRAKTVPVASQLVARSGSAAGVADRQAWLYVGSDITPDPAWRFGTLTNGVRYAVRRNGVPPGQISVRVRIDAGSLMERDSERGYAHLIEHLSFRGSTYVADGEAKRVWQRFGATFGSDSNAQTTPTQTVYKLDLPSATEASIDESMKILAGMVASPNITTAALGVERPAVLAEQREQPGPAVRLNDATSALFFAGQPLAERSPIGTIEMLEKATPDSVKAFHDRWYRPERAVVVVAGDFDPAMLERLVAKNFAGWQGKGANPADPDFGATAADKPETAAIVEAGLPTLVRIAVVRPWQYNDDTVIFNQKRLVDQLALDVINRRLETRARGGGSYISAQVGLDDIARSANITFVTINPVGTDWAGALRDVRAVIADAQASPPSKSEIDRELADRTVAFRTLVDTAAAEAAARQADDMVQAVDIRETTTAATTIQRVFREAQRKGMFSPALVFASTKRMFQGVATRALISTPKSEEGVTAKLATALKADVSGVAAVRTTQGKVAFAALPKLGRAAMVVKRDRLEDLGVDRAILSNGSRVMVYSSESEDDRVYVRVRFGQGYNALPADRATPAWAADLALVSGGVGTLKQGDLDQLTAGRRIGLTFDIEDDAFSYSALTSPTDLGDQLRLIAAAMAAPGFDPAPLARAKTFQLSTYDGMDASPDGVLGRDLQRLMRDGDRRWGTPTREEVSATTAADFEKLWRPLLATGPVEVQIFGDVKTDAAIAAAARTIGALPPRAATAATPAPVRFPAHNALPVNRTHDGPANQAAAVIAWPTGSGIDDIFEARRLDVLAAIFNDRLFDQLRSGAGASYSPSVSSNWPVGLTGGGALTAIGQVPPDKVALFFTLARGIAADLAAKPIDADELKRTIGPMTQALMRQSSGNQFWLGQLGGASYDERRFDALRRLFGTITTMTAVELQDTAQRYLRPDRDWTMQVLPKAGAK